MLPSYRSLLTAATADQRHLSRNFRSLCFTRSLYSFLLFPRSVLYSTNLSVGANAQGMLSVPANRQTESLLSLHISLTNDDTMLTMSSQLE